MIQLQQFLQREKSHKEVAALLHQHLDVRPVSQVGFSLAVQILIVLEMLFYLFAFPVVLHPFGVLLGFSIGPGWLALSPQIRLIGSIILLSLAIVALVLHLLLPVDRPFLNYFAPLGILACPNALVGCVGLSYIFLPHSPTQSAAYVTLFAGIGVGMVIFFLFFSITQRKDARVSIAQARTDLAQTHLALEQITVTRKYLLQRPKDQKNMTALEKATQAEIPRFYLARHPDGTFTVAFKADLPIPLMQRLAALPPKTAFTDHEAAKRILEEDAPCEDIWTGNIYTFPETIAPQDYPNVISMLIPWDRGWETGEQEDEEEEKEEEKPKEPDAGEWDTSLLAYVVDERIVAACRAQKINDVAAEAWVQPEPSNGNESRQVALTWAYEMRHSGKIPFFSHHIDDEGAADLARSLGLPLVVEEVDYY